MEDLWTIVIGGYVVLIAVAIGCRWLNDRVASRHD